VTAVASQRASSSGKVSVIVGLDTQSSIYFLMQSYVLSGKRSVLPAPGARLAHERNPVLSGATREHFALQVPAFVHSGVECSQHSLEIVSTRRMRRSAADLSRRTGGTLGRGRMPSAAAHSILRRAAPGILAPLSRESAMSDEQDWNRAIIDEFRANSGQVAAPYADPPPMVLVHTLGARTGAEHIVPMRAMPDGDALYIFASAHGTKRNPDWYHNLRAHPDVTIEMGTETVVVRATELVGPARDAIFARHAARFPVFADYARRLEHTIPVIRLDRG
jgi:deazaflavin-dependent oxidoreductase (nitroreductase family)